MRAKAIAASLVGLAIGIGFAIDHTGVGAILGMMLGSGFAMSVAKRDLDPAAAPRSRRDG